jgi:hypothetical protein
MNNSKVMEDQVWKRFKSTQRVRRSAMKRLHGYRKDEEGVSGAVTATLIVATLTVIFSGMYAVVVPVWVENAEADHMRQVSNDFTKMKKNIDSLILEEEGALTVSSSITLQADPTNNWFGVEGKRFLGELTVDPYSEVLNLSNAENPTEVYGTCQGAIYFQSMNQQYTPQKYVYSNGQVIRIQEEAEEKGVTLAAPEFSLYDELGNRTLVISTITLFGEPTTISGSKSVSVQTSTIDSIVALYEGGLWDDGVNVTINATSNLGYIKVYHHYYEDTLVDLGYVDGVDFNSTRSGDSFGIEIKDVNKIILYTGTILVELK